MASSDSPPIVSPTGIIHVLGYTPTEGERGVPITVRIHFRPDLADAMYVRLVVGNKAVPTKVRQLPAVSYGRWQLHAAAPPFDRAHSPSTKVLISVQALTEENAILDSVTFGEFSYWASGTLSLPFFFFSLGFYSCSSRYLSRTWRLRRFPRQAPSTADPGRALFAQTAQ
jgi:hypothetical protein